jgi:hypothetical protein
MTAALDGLLAAPDPGRSHCVSGYLKLLSLALSHVARAYRTQRRKPALLDGVDDRAAACAETRASRCT